MKKICLIMLLFCNSAFALDPTPELTRYRTEFEYLFHRNTDYIEIKFVDQIDPSLPEAVGYCYYGSRNIAIVKSYWDKSSPIMREMLLFHELGHCALDKKHSDIKYSDGCSASIMSARLSTDECYMRYYNQLVVELSKIQK